MPRALRKASITLSGALTRGPLISFTRSGWWVGKPSTQSARRRGVAKPSARVKARPSSFSFSVTRRFRSWAARVCMGAGISSDRSSRRNSAIVSARLGRAAATGEPALATAFGQRAYPADIGLALGHRDHAAGIQQIEQMARLHALIVCGQRQRRWPIQQDAAFPLGVLEMTEKHRGIGDLEVVGGELAFGLKVAVGIGHAAFTRL